MRRVVAKPARLHLQPDDGRGQALGQDGSRIGALALQVVGQVVVADGAVLRIAGLVREPQGDLLEAHGRGPVPGLVLQVGQGAVDLAQHRDVPLLLKDGPALQEQGARLGVASQAQQGAVVVEAGAGQLQRAGAPRLW